MKAISTQFVLLFILSVSHAASNSATPSSLNFYSTPDTLWFQVAKDIQGESSGSLSGTSISLSADGNRVAVSARSFNDGSGTVGQVRVYHLGDNGWFQMGTSIVGENSGDNFGVSISLSGDGSTLAIGAPLNDDTLTNEGKVVIYEWNGTDWTQKGADILGGSTSDQSGTSVALSADGERLVVGSPFNSDTVSTSGKATVYEYSGGVWEQLGGSVYGVATSDQFGTAVAISADGTTIVVGAKNNDNGNTNAGLVRVYQLVANSWTQMGTDITGQISGGNLGNAVAVSEDGGRIAIGEELANSSTGNVYVYDFDTDWTLVGSALSGSGTSEKFGNTIALSNSGDILAVGAENFSSTTGKVSVYQLVDSEWQQLVDDFSGSNTNEYLGSSVSLSGNGLQLAIGAEGRSSAVNNLGFTQVYELLDTLTPPVLDFPDDEATVPIPVRLQWKEKYPADVQFNVHVATSDAFSDTVQVAEGVTKPSFDLADSLDFDGTYHWRVQRQAVADTNFVSDWENRQFTTSSDVDPPVLLFPDNNGTAAPSFDLVWEGESFPDLYNFTVHVAFSEDFSDTLKLESNYIDSTLTLTQEDSLLVGNTYYWRVMRASVSDTSRNSDWADRAFNVEVSEPTGLLPDAGSSAELPLTLSWDTTSSDYEFDFHFSTQSDFSDTLIYNTGLDNPTYELTVSDSLAVGEIYFWQVRRRGTVDTSLVSDWATSSLIITVEQPNLVFPIDTLLTPPDLSILWEVADSEDYELQLQISRSASFGDTVLLEESLASADSSYNLENIALDSGTHYYRMRRIASENTTLVSSWVSSEFNVFIPIPTLLTPSNSTILSQPITFSWEAINEADFTYEINISINEDYSTIAYQNSTSGTSPSISVSSLDANESYFWRVRGEWTGGTQNISSAWSESRTFTIRPDFVRLTEVTKEVNGVVTTASSHGLPSFVNVLLRANDEESLGITSLRSEDFELAERNSQGQFEVIRPEETFIQSGGIDQVPTTLKTVLMLDNSLSIGESNLELLKEAAKQLVRNKIEEQEISLFVFADAGQLDTLEQFTKDTSALISAIDNISLSQIPGTDLYGAAITGLMQWEDEFDLSGIVDGYMLLFTDGKDEAGVRTINEVISERGNKKVFAVAVEIQDGDVEEDKLQQIGNAGVFIDSTFSDLVATFDEVQRRLIRDANSFYWLNYQSAKRQGDQTVEVRVKNNENNGSDRSFRYDYNADGFWGFPRQIVVDGGPGNEFGIDTLFMSGDGIDTANVQSVFAFVNHPLAFDISDPEKLQIVSIPDSAFYYEFTADGSADEVITVVITDTVAHDSLGVNPKTFFVKFTDRTSGNRPQIADQTFDIPEESPVGTAVGTVVASDPDGDNVILEILSGNNGGAFDLDAGTGALTVANSALLDYETDSIYVLVVQASDGVLTNLANITINITDIEEGANQPPLVSDQAFTAFDGSEDGFAIGTVVATDADGDQLAFTITEGNDDNTFAINSTSGLLTIATSTNLNAIATPQYLITVSVSDGQQSANAQITINIEAGEPTAVNIVNSTFSVFPNPVNHMMEIQGLDITQISVVEVIDASGRVSEIEIQAGTIDVSDIRPGVYLLKIEVNEELHLVRFIKE